jgi:hypothetical protein
MATAPTSRRLNLTRDQLAAFLTDQQQIRQFELLFSTVDELQVIVGTDFEYQADTAAATANEALAQLSALAQDTAVEDAVLNAKVQQALDAIPRLAQALELLAAAPVIENNNSVVTDYIDFNTTTPSPAVKVGRMHWNGGYTLNLEMTPNVNQAIGESQYYYIKASAAIAKGQLVMFDGSVGASGVLKGKPSTGVTPDLGAKPGQPQTQDSPIAKPGEEKPGAAEPAKAPATAQAAAKGKSMSKQEIMSWISRNDEDNAALQSFKDAIAAAEKAEAPAAEPAASAPAKTAAPAATPNYGKATPGVQNTQAAPGKVSYAPKTAAPAATPAPAAKQPQMASKQYKKVPL